ncbi:VOC family protein [Micromonospora sp. BRA006-A]|nr:VOC family protein [Micromonospora sp. BRA006-A]
MVREAELHAGDTLIMLHGADPGYWAKQSAPGPVGHMCIVYVEDVDAHHKATVAAGVDAPEPEDQPYGARIYIVTDPGGHQWTFWQHLTDEAAGAGLARGTPGVAPSRQTGSGCGRRSGAPAARTASAT